MEQAIAETMEGTEGDVTVVESRWSKAFKLTGDLADITGMMASFVGAITSGLQLFRDIKNGKDPAVIAFDAIEVCITIQCRFSIDMLLFYFNAHYTILSIVVRAGKMKNTYAIDSGVEKRSFNKNFSMRTAINKTAFFDL